MQRRCLRGRDRSRGRRAHDRWSVMTGHRGRRVLIAEDDASIRRMLTVSLRRQGYQTFEACDGEQALVAMRAGHADLVVLDLMMPKVTGFQVLAARAADPTLRKIPVIVVTAERGADATNLDGISALVPKPFNLDALQALVKSSLAATAER
jgi:CheY-like chemotaxis protein